MSKLPAWNQPRVIHLQEIAHFAREQFVNEPLFDGDGFYGRLLCFLKGQSVPEHVHEHIDQCFDVLEGEGTILVNGKEVQAVPGTTIYVSAGTWHALRADGSEQWLVRETVHERVYARRALRLLGRVFLKRLPFLGHHWR